MILNLCFVVFSAGGARWDFPACGWVGRQGMGLHGFGFGRIIGFATCVVHAPLQVGQGVFAQFYGVYSLVHNKNSGHIVAGAG